MAGDGNGDGGDEAARLRLGGSSRRKKQMRRSSWTARRGEVVAVAVGTAIGVGELARWRSVFAGERARGESEREERAVGAAWRREGGPGRRGGSGRKQEVAGARACARQACAVLLAGGGRRQGRRRWAGPLQWWAGPSGGYTGEAR